MRIAALAICAAIVSPSAILAQTVDGTDGTNELGKLSCAALASQPAADCPYEYLRKDDGTATLRVLLPGGSVRYIYFEDGQPTSTDSTERMQAEPFGQGTLIYIGDAERFEVPASITGS